MNDISHSDTFAVIGMAGRFPGARDLAAFWDNLQAGRESIFRGEGAAAGILEGAEYFDAEHFGYSPREALLMDPQQRLLLECAWQAIEDAGYPPRRCSRELPVGLFACSSDTDYASRQDVEPAYWPMVSTGNDRDLLAPRISYKLDLRGPSVVVQTACSSALVCVHMACQSLLCGESDMALAGAVSLALPQLMDGPLLEGGIVSPDGRCRAFDAGARGTVRGYGLGVVVLRRLEDALDQGDHVRAVILGSAVNNDGADKVGFSAPGVRGQAAVVAEALAVAGVEPRAVSYVEAHGSGTTLGDPLEVAALNRAFSGSAGRCALGSVKTNIGHLDAAAGMAGFIKTVLCLERARLVPSLHYQQPNPKIDFAGGPFFVNTEAAPWPGPGPRVAGVSSFGMGGTNAHVVLAEAPGDEARGQGSAGQPGGHGEQNLLVLSARTGAALESAACRLAEHLRRQPSLAPRDVAFTLQAGREQMASRLALVCEDLQQAAAALEQRDPRRVHSAVLDPGGRPGGGQVSHRPVTFMFSGLGDQQPGMGQDLYDHEPEFSRQVDRCAELLRPFLKLDLREVLYPGDRPPAPSTLRLFGRGGDDPDRQQSKLDSPRLAHPALFVLGYAMARMWMARGLHPREMIGYSIGEYVAACLAGVFSLQDALHLVALRARLVMELPAGAMVAVPAPEEQVLGWLGQGLHVAAINGPSLCVVSGELAAVEALQARLAEEGLASMRLRACRAFHSPLMEPCREELVQLVASLPRGQPTIPFVSNLTGTWITAEQAQDPGYWAAHMTHPVRFGDGLGTLCEDPSSLLLELGPGQTLSSMAIGVLRGAGQGERPVVASLPAAPGEPGLCLDSLGQVWLAGCEVDWPVARGGRRVPLPTTCFQRRRYVLQRASASANSGSSPSSVGPVDSVVNSSSARVDVERRNLTTAYLGPETREEQALVACWERAFGLNSVGVHDNFFDLGGHSLLAVQMLHDLRRASGMDLSPRDVMDHPTIRELAQRAALPGAPPEAPKGQTPEDLEEVVSQLLPMVARGMDVTPDSLAPDQQIPKQRLNEAAPHVIWSVKRRWGVPLYPHEVLGRPTVTALAELVSGALSGGDPGPAPASPGLQQEIAKAAQTARREVVTRLPRRNGSAAFILSSARSGSTLLRVMLAGHPDLFCPPEMHLLMYETLAQRAAALPSEHFGRGLVRALQELLGPNEPPDALLAELAEAPMARVYGRLQRLARPQLLVDKSPSYAARVETLCRAETMFEAPRYVFLTRHPHAVMESYVRTRMAAMSGPAMSGPNAPDQDAHAEAEFHWTSHNRNVLEFLERVPEKRHLQVRFEELVRSPRQVMEGLCEFLQVPFDNATLEPYEGRRMTDGPGDPAFHEHQGIDPRLGEAWRRVELPRALTVASADVARRLGYYPR